MDSFLRLRLVPAAVLLLIALSSAQACTVHRAELSLECRLASKLEDCFPSSTHRWARKLADCFGESGDVRSDDTQHRLLEKWKHTPRPIMCMDCADGASDGEEHSLSVPIAASLRFRGKHAAKEQQSADLGAAAGDVPKLASYNLPPSPDLSGNYGFFGKMPGPQNKFGFAPTPYEADTASSSEPAVLQEYRYAPPS